MIDAIVFSAVAVLVVFTLAWIFRPDLRAWIEEPKYRFLERTIQYDESQETK